MVDLSIWTNPDWELGVGDTNIYLKVSNQFIRFYGQSLILLQSLVNGTLPPERFDFRLYVQLYDNQIPINRHAKCISSPHYVTLCVVLWIVQRITSDAIIALFSMFYSYLPANRFDYCVKKKGIHICMYKKLQLHSSFLINNWYFYHFLSFFFA